MTRLLDLGEGDPVPPTADWDRIRFRTWSEDDPRPVKFPPPGPYWVTGTAYDPAGDYAILPLGAVPTDQSSWSPERIEAEAYRQRALLEALRPNKD